MTVETKVGLFVVTAFIVLTGIIFGVHATRTVGGQVRFKTYLRDAGGLDADTSVLFGGIRVGQITTVRPGRGPPTRSAGVSGSPSMPQRSMSGTTC